jgi:hypothetical protein
MAFCRHQNELNVTNMRNVTEILEEEIPQICKYNIKIYKPPPVVSRPLQELCEFLSVSFNIE